MKFGDLTSIAVFETLALKVSSILNFLSPLTRSSPFAHHGIYSEAFYRNKPHDTAALSNANLNSESVCKCSSDQIAKQIIEQTLAGGRNAEREKMK